MASRVDSDFLELQTALAGEYSLERELGRGGMGIVYLAREVQLNRLVAIKVLPSSEPDLRERFLREARMAASLSHPNIVPIYRVGEAGPFVVLRHGVRRRRDAGRSAQSARTSRSGPRDTNAP